MQEEINWYLDRICYYESLSKNNPEENQTNEKRYKLYGGLEEYTSFEGAKNMHNFWVEGLSLFVKEEIKRKVIKETGKLRKILGEKENIIRELVELTK